jgi:hypothetical protein
VSDAPDIGQARIIVGTFGHTEAVVYEVPLIELRVKQADRVPDAGIAEWAMRRGREVFRTNYALAYGVDG